MRLRRSDPAKPGLTRSGRRVLDAAGDPVRDPETLDRVKSLVIPPAWKKVWIAPDPRGHIQAVGVDAAGRRQYLYHPVWREQQDRAKFDRVLELAERLPEVRDRLTADLTGRGLTRTRVLAAVVGLLDMGMFRVGGAESAAREEDPSYGLSTLRPDHVRTRGGCVILQFVGKSGVEQNAPVGHLEICTVLRDLKRRRRGEDRLFAHWDASARRWRHVHATTINEYLREISGEEMTAKDFRTWHGTVRAATALAEIGPQPTATARRKAVAGAMREVADLLGNTPAVARASYVDPRVVEAFEQGEVAEGEDEVRDLLA
ncbi:DNA topoisomerase IB [Actinoplanes sp. G11-F43]|uniref:DNA topoisomerase IB n=1 Tax=Actinoplanes sp. G11-F43 TaxID=3424130 RepID=UPI003D3592F0